MTAQISLPTTVRRPVVWQRLAGAGVVPWVIGLVLLVRLSEFRSGGSPDEGGFLVVAGQWHAGTSLYGNYWVDRPPGLIGLFRVADLFGGLGALRVLGALAACAAVALLASSSRRVFGPRAAAWTAVVAGALLVSPLYGAVDVNGELLALPFIALGVRAAIEAVHATEPLAARTAALLTGAAAMSALLVKQNMADVFVFAAVLWTASLQQRGLSWRTLTERVVAAASGAVAAYAVVMLWAMAHGTSPLGVYQATYPFRVRAAHVIAASSSQSAGIRLSHLVSAWTWSAVPLLVLAFLLVAVRRSRTPAATWAVIALLGYSGFSVLAGGSYWLHYLVETVPAVALAAGATSLAAPRLLRPLAVLVTCSALVAAGVVAVRPTPTPGTSVGEALHQVARPGDTVMSAFGDADILRSTGMSSPYPYLWSLPSRTLDPDLTLLREVFAGPEAPTWVVVRGPSTIERLATHDVLGLIDSRYRQVADLCGRRIYLRRDQQRATPVDARTCTGTALP
ncbi:MAG: hypothetical protein ACJ72D_08670 [Marmoricola sp.]